VKDQYFGVRVLDQVHQLFVQVPVIDVDGHGAVLEGAVLGDQILRAVVEIQCHLGALAHAGTV